MQIGVEPLDRFKANKFDEPKRLSPVFVERVSLRDALAVDQGLNLRNMFGSIELLEPTFQV